jgi:hypothetical protein
MRARCHAALPVIESKGSVAQSPGMNATGPRKGAAPSPRPTIDRAAVGRRLSTLTVTAALAGVGAVAGFGYLASVSDAGATASAAVAATASSTTASSTTGASVDAVAPVASSAATPLQPAEVPVVGSSGTGQVSTGGS